MIKHFVDFFKGCLKTGHQLVKKYITKKVVFLLVLVGLQYMVLGRIKNPSVGDYQVFQQVEGTRQGGYVETVSLEQMNKRVGLFAANILSQGFDWQPNQGFDEEGIVYPRNFHSISFYFDMDSSLRQKWLLSRAVSYKKSGFSFDRFLKGDYVSKVELSGRPIVSERAKGLWDAEVRAVRIVVDTNNSAKGAAYREKLSFKFSVRETNTSGGAAWGLENSPLTPLFSKIQKDGLKIVDFKELA